MSFKPDDRNGAGPNASYSTSMHSTMYNANQPGFSWPYAALQQNAAQKDDVLAALAQFNIDGSTGGAHNATTGSLMPITMNNLLSTGGPYYHFPDGRIVPSRLPASAFQNMRTETGNPTIPATTTLPYTGLVSGVSTGVSGPQGMPWNMGHQGNRENVVPELTGPRRNSLSSDENGPRTPFIGASNQADAHPKIVYGGSPNTWTTPSPHQLGNGSPPLQIAKSPTGQYYFADLNSICVQDPPIPKPIPAIFSGEKGRGTLEKSLQNNLNTTNVYIRGLHPNTTDDMLHSYGSRFGKIISAKSMLDQETGNCKGFGFIKYHNFTDGENCIRAFFHWGYEAKWARVSHNEKLKTLGDENNTNLYVSNLPLDFNEHSLTEIFQDYAVLSAKILRDTNGMSRGVGFARFDTPDVCRKVIDQYSGVKIGEEGHLLSIRFADTPEQKKLKSVTAERRQYKASEYNTAAYSPGSPYAATIPATAFNTPVPTRTVPAYWPHNFPAPLFPSYTTTPMPNLASSTSVKVPLAPGQPNVDVSRNRARIESPKVLGTSKRSLNIVSPSKSDIGVKVEQRYPRLTQDDAKSSPIKQNEYSPVKHSPSKVMAKSTVLR